MITSAGTSSSK